MWTAGCKSNDLIHRLPQPSVGILSSHVSPRPSLSYLTSSSLLFADVCSIGNHLLLTHARAVDIYRKKFQSLQKGQIGITLVRLPRLTHLTGCSLYLRTHRSRHLEHRMDGAI